ncbi:uncharacterized protein golgb1 [Stigmatopora argus]
MFNPLATVLQELSGEEGQDGETQAGELAHQLPPEVVQSPADAEAPEEAMERLAHLEQLVVQLKELIRDKDTQLASKDALLKNERETSEARFSKLKLQAKARITSLSKQIEDLKGQEGTTSTGSSFSKDAEDDLQELRNKLHEEVTNSSQLRAQLQAAEELLKEKDATHNEQLRLLQAVVQDKDVRFQQQIQKHEEELQSATTPASNDGELQKALHEARRRCEELEEALKSRSQVLEMLQQEVVSADQQKQILTAEFRKMEDELAEALEQKQEWAQRASDADAAVRDVLARANEEAARHAADLSSLSEVASVGLEKEKAEVARLQGEMVSMADEMASMAESVRACRDGSQRDELEISRLQKQLASSREAESEIVRASRSDLEETKDQVEKLRDQLAFFKGAAQKKKEVLAEIWRHFHTLPFEVVRSLEDEMVPEDLSLILDTVLSIEAHVTKLKDDHRESEDRCAELTCDLKALQEQLDRRTNEREDAVANVQQLEQQIKPPSESQSLEPPADETDRATILLLEQQLSEKDRELSVLEERLRLVEEPSAAAGHVAPGQNVDQAPGQVEIGDSGDNLATPPGSLEDTQEEETTLVAEDTSILSVSAGNESSPELLEHQESPEESKGTSSDEMVTSTDSEVVHSSWTLLEAVNQDGRQEWPSVIQDFGQLQSWDPETSSLSATPSSVIMQETVSGHVAQKDAPAENVPSAFFAQAVAEQLQIRYGELLAELQTLREAAAESREKIDSLEEETQKLVAEKEGVEAQARDFEEELIFAREKLQNLSQRSTSEAEKWSAEMRLLEEQIEILSSDRTAKEEEMQALQADMELAHQTISNQESKSLILSAQLDDRELELSKLGRRLQDVESHMLEQMQKSVLDNDSLSKKEAEICELQERLDQNQQKMAELDQSMSAKLSQVEEERVLIDSQVDKLKAQLVELTQLKEDSAAPDKEEEELASLRRSKGELETQLVSTRKKLQVVLVQRKELMKKVAELEMEAKMGVEKEEAAPSERLPEGLKPSVEEIELKLAELERTLSSKDETIESLRSTIIQREQLLSETLAERKDNETERAESDDSLLLSQVASLETECESLQKKVSEAQESRKESIRKAKEKDRHHRDQLKQQKEEYAELSERFELQSGERKALLAKVGELEERIGRLGEELPSRANKNLEKTSDKDWVQEDWVDFPGSETDSEQTQSVAQEDQGNKQSGDASVQTQESLKAIGEEIRAMRLANAELENRLEETQSSLSQKEMEVQEISKELLALRENEGQIKALSDEMNDLREKHLQAESCAEALKAEMEAATAAASAQSADSMAALQAEVEEFKLFLDSKNREITELSQQLGEQNASIVSMQNTVADKDRLIASLEEELDGERERSKKSEVEVPRRQEEEEEEESETKLQQLQRKLQAALISRKELLRENKTQKEELSSSQSLVTELMEKMQGAQEELEKLRTERTRLIEEVDRTLIENQSLGSSCESLKLAMDAMASEKDACRREGELAREEADRACREWEEKVRGMKEEYETLLSSYENVSDEAERVRLVLEAARQERQELATKVRAIESSKEEAEMEAQEARKEAELVKDKMRKFVKAKQQKILELEEETERLRQGQEKDIVKSQDEAPTAELNRLREERKTLKSDYEAAVAEIETLKQQMELKKELDQAQDLSVPQMKDKQNSETETIESKEAAESKQNPDEQAASESAVGFDSELTTQVVSLEDKFKAMEVNLHSEKCRWQEREAQLQARMASLEQDLQKSNEKASLFSSLEECLRESKERESGLMEEASKREVHFKELLGNLESEKDNLEERLMNQLAQLNGSIAGYQQEAAAHREDFSELRRELERLEGQRGDLEDQARAQTDRAARLEEDVRQAQRQRAEAEAETGKRRELEQQLRSAHRVQEGSQSRARQLEELLREKQMEVRQLQKDSIRYQERISQLGVEAKALQLDRHELTKNLEQSQQKNSIHLEELKRSETELAHCKANLDETNEQFKKLTVEKATLDKSILQKEALWKAEAEQNLDSVRFRLGAELKEMEVRLEEAYGERDKEEEATSAAREAAEVADRRARETQARLDESLARLAAFSRCMSSLQDDRDRVLDEARQWETRFNDTLLGKEAEIREAETRAGKLAENFQKECSLKEELQLSLERLEKAAKERQLESEEVEKNLNQSRAEAERDRAQLLQTAAEMRSAQNQALLLGEQVEGHRQRARTLEEAVTRLREDVSGAQLELREREAEYRRLCLTLEQLEADLHASKASTESLQVALLDKEKREVDMLHEKEQAIAQAAEDAREEAEARARDAEEELEHRRGELRDAEEKLRKAEETSDVRRSELDSFTKAMGSLQDDRDRLLATYKQLEEKHLQVMLDKDAVIQESANENNGLKEELRSLLVQRDDLHAEKAKLSAQLHGYRDELKQVLSMKDTQHKQLLAAQREQIASLEKERHDLENALRNQDESETVHEERTMPGAEAEKLREQLEAAREQARALEEDLLGEREEHEKETKELSQLRWEGGLMRTESESAQERVAELARDLLAVEQKLLEEKELAAQLRAENLSFGKAMASLQDSKDLAERRAQQLGLKLEEVGKAGSSSPNAAGEVWSLKNALRALQNDREILLEELQAQTSHVKSQKLELARLGAGELIKVSQELLEEKKKNAELASTLQEMEGTETKDKHQIETLRLEHEDYLAQAEHLKQQTLSALSERDQQLRQLTAMLEEARGHTPKRQKEHCDGEVSQEVDSAPGGPQERNSSQEARTSRTELLQLQQRLEEEIQQRLSAEDQLMEAQDRLRRQDKWEDHSETAVFIEPPEGTVTRTRRGATGGCLRALRSGTGWRRRRTPLLLGVYLLSVHVLLLLCVGGYL